MDYTFTQTEIDIFYLCFLGFSVVTAWQAGKQQGMSDTIDYFHEKGVIDLDDD